MDDLEEKAKYLNVNDPTEEEYSISCEKIINHVVELYRDAKMSFAIFDSFKKFFDKSVEKEIKAFLNVNNWTMTDFQKHYLGIKKYISLLEKVPVKIYFPLFEIDTNRIKEILFTSMDELRSKLIYKYETYMINNLRSILEKYNSMTKTL